MARLSVIPDLHPDSYPRHALHGEECVWVEKNCYVDLWIEALHALRLDPLAMLPFTIAADFEGDQWTFFKPSHEELRDLYGVNVQELTVWRPLLEHALEHVRAGKWISTEADAWWLPDTAATDYRRKHTKTTIIINDIDVDARRLGYFHNAGYYWLEGEDFINTFRLDSAPDAAFMPLFAEFVRIDSVVHLSQADLVARSRELWRRHLQRVPRTNPIARFRARVEQDLSALQAQGLEHYHAWAFAATRQAGAAFELAAANLRWLETHGHAGLGSIAADLDVIATSNKAFILKGARAVSARKPLDFAATFDDMHAAWDRAIGQLHDKFGR